ncbi:hypothetical protein HMP0015_1282 [Acinetobacter haemolyticus ATCC 19194]|uniref:Uncharacterized protein n=1 Tax=Acinetobacter haemolyticus ATCC 19194 TaxID=707232 RepID=D4XNJ0_ACIHA|nr:hypothetical protein HMP0015_1282 [Acinetobacter haemolyticus ATCC 19194]
MDFITFYKKDSFHNNFIAKNIINRLNKINLMDGINFDCNTNTIFLKPNMVSVFYTWKISRL